MHQNFFKAHAFPDVEGWVKRSPRAEQPKVRVEDRGVSHEPVGMLQKGGRKLIQTFAQTHRERASTVD